MITALDSSILLDVLTADLRFAATSERALREARRLGAIVACPAVWAEVRGRFDARGTMETALAEAGIEFDPFDQRCANLAGEMWRQYRAAGGKRERLVADFLIGAHATLRGEGRLLSRDRGFYRRYFPRLRVLSG